MIVVAFRYPRVVFQIRKRGGQGWGQGVALADDGGHGCAGAGGDGGADERLPRVVGVEQFQA
jgi:hypothetical protein